MREKIMRVLVVIVMLMMLVPAFSQGIWNNEGFPSEFGSGNANRTTSDGFANENDWDNQLGVGEMQTNPVPDGLGVLMIASLLYGIYLVRKHRHRDTVS
jgi:hypothetical protein